ncbi:MAG: helicase-related protein, partial [Lachnospira sp.]|nr:helicase-related protein [Lachnospira sp.]
ETVESINQLCFEVNSEEKYELFKQLLIYNNPDKAMIFCGTRQMVDVLCRKLARDGIRCGMIHGDIEQRDRIRTIDRFKSGAFRYLIATDVAARGIDVDDLTHVFNYDFPTGRETYVHRIGRTGRNGKKGTAVSIVCPEDKKMFQMVQEYIGMKLPTDVQIIMEKDMTDQFWLRHKERPKTKPKKGADFNRTITRLSIGGGKKSKMRAVDIVGTLCSIDGMTSDDIGIIDVRDSLVYVDILNGKGEKVLEVLQTKPVKGKVRKVRISRTS